MEVEQWLNRLRNGRVRAFADEKPDEEALSRYGLAPVETLELSLFVGEDRAEKRLRIGGETEQGRYYARDMSAPQVFLIDSTLVRQLQKEADDLRDRKPVKFVRDEVTRVELDNSAGERIVAEKDTAGVWSIVSPEPRKARSWKFERLMSDLEGLEVQEFVRPDDAGYRSAKQDRLLVCRLSDGEESLLESRFGVNVDELERPTIHHLYAHKAKLHRCIPEAGYTASFTFADDAPLHGEANYRVRVEQRNGQRAWSSPIWVRPASA